MNKRLLLVILCIANCTVLYAQHATLQGTITTADGRPAEATTVKIKNTAIGAFTDAKGNYKLSSVKAGTYTLHVSAVGFVSQDKSITAKDGINTINFTLRADDGNLQEVSIAGSRKKYKVDEPSTSLRLNEPLIQVAQNIQVVTSDQLKDEGVFNMLENVSRNVSGVTMQEHWGNYARLNTRGDRVAPFRNGFNIESSWGPLNEDMAFVDRIEFVKGPAGFMLANGNPSGFYNVVTKKPTGMTRQSVDVSVGSFNTYRAAVDLDGVLTHNGKLQYRLNLMGQLSDSWQRYNFTNRYGIDPVLRYKFDDKNTLTAEYTYQFQRQSILGSGYVFSLNGYADRPRSFTNIAPNFPPTNIYDNSAFLTYEHKFNNSWKFTAQGAYFNYKQRGYNYWIDTITAAGDIKREIDLWDANSRNKYAQAFVNGDVQTGIIRHRILGGVDIGDKYYIADFNQAASVDNDTYFNIYNPNYSDVVLPQFDHTTPLSIRGAADVTLERYQSGYIQDELGFLNQQLRVTLAARYTADHIEQYGAKTTNHKFTPRAGVSYSIDDVTSVYGVYDQAFLPQTGVLYSGGTVNPITGNNIEGGIKRDWFDNKWSTSVSVYQIIKNNQLVNDFDHQPEGYYVVQLGQTKTNGVEFDARGEITSGLNLMFNYAYTNSRITKDTEADLVGTQVPGFAKHVNNAWLTYRIQHGNLHGLGFSMGYQWQLKRFPWSFDQGDKSDLPNYFRLDGAVTYQIQKFNIGVNVNNILNAYLYSGGHNNYITGYAGTVYTWQAEAPTNIRATVGYRF